jgi:branched-chain amino acid transport system permease protein
VHLLIQSIIVGVLTGGVYALMATGQTLIFGVMRVINVAQGAMVILAAYLSSSLFNSFGIDPFLSILITAPILFVLGFGIHATFLRRLRPEQGELSLLIMFAVALGIEGVLGLEYSTTYRTIRTGYVNRSFTIAGYHVALVRLLAFGLSAVILVGLFVLLNRSRFGRSVRATVQNPTSARLLGVEPTRVAAIGFGLGAATAAAAGAVYGLVYPFNGGSHYDLISRLLSIVMLGGLGSLGGSVIAALVMGVAESVVAANFSPIWANFTFFAVLLAVLVFRPRGLFGVAQRGAL